MTDGPSGQVTRGHQTRTLGERTERRSRRHVRNGTAIMLVVLLLAIIVATGIQLIQSS